MQGHFESFGGNMELPKFVVDAAKSLVAEGAELPAAIEGSAGFFVAEATDESIQTFNGFEIEGVPYKIGTKKV